MKFAIASFAKTVGLSPVKTRLATSIGQEKAEAFYTLSVACVEETLEAAAKQNPNIYPHWALADEAAVGLYQWQKFPNLFTGEGGLGERLFNISNRLFETHDVVILIGTDSPQMSAGNIMQVVESFQTDHITGPATDGGFWLWASKKPLPLSVWKNVTYSVDTTLKELVGAVNNLGHAISEGAIMQDVDLIEDIFTLQNTLEQQEDMLLPAQVSLLKWLKENNPTFQV